MKQILLIQIDSLSYDVLQKAIKEGYVPYIGKLINNGWNFREIFSGLPSTTPAAQVNLFYGQRLLPGFRFVEKKEKKVFSAEYPEMVEWLENSLYLKKTKGLLREGMGVLSIFSGGSEKSISANMIDRNRFIIFKYLPYLINPISIIFRFLRALALLFIEWSENIKGKHVQSGKSYAFKRIFHEVILSELGLYAVKKMIPAKEKIIFINFSGYDEISHHYGGYSRFALYYLSIVDQYVKVLHKEILKKNSERELLIISDHGQTPSIPISEYSGISIGEKIAAFFPQKRIVEHRLEYKSNYLSKTDLYLLNSGGFCQGYHINQLGQLAKSDLEKKYPNIIDNISRLDEVELVAYRQKDIFVSVKGKSYKLTIKNCPWILKNIQAQYREKVMKGLIQIMSGPFAPDFCVLAKIIDENKVIVFENQLSAHGAAGGMQTQSFIISQNSIIKNDQLIDLVDLHDLLEKKLYAGKI